MVSRLSSMFLKPRKPRRHALAGGRARPHPSRERGEPRPVFSHLLVPIDFTRKNERTLAAALEIAAANRAGTTLLHVVSPLEGTSPAPGLKGLYEGLENEAREKLQGIARRFQKKALPVHTAVRTGRPLVEILEAARRDGVDLVIMSSHPVTPERPDRDSGTVSYRVADLCQCPVLLVK